MRENEEERVFWKNDPFVGEGLWHRSHGTCGVVVCHPHPLMGGSMYNNVVETVSDVFSSCDHSTLRFNFRGVGGSTGRYDEGRGETQDILSACEFLKSQGVEKIILAGYSFGAWVACRLIAEKNVFSSVLLISPPQKYFDFDWTRLKNAVNFIICGAEDQFCDADDLREKAQSIHSELIILPGTDHF
ncbi:MAG: hypothetical protein EG826_15520, partial [Deltaproteobacteria bacterium]|nr:hypothetical protein [Deltaproteobacteria bacterium]